PHVVPAVGARHTHPPGLVPAPVAPEDRKSTRLNSSHVETSYAVFCLKKKRWQRPGSHVRGAASGAGGDAGKQREGTAVERPRSARGSSGAPPPECVEPGFFF